MNKKVANILFEDIYKNNFDLVYRFVYYMSKNQSISEDICSKIFMQTFEIILNDSWYIENPKAWLFRCARNEFLNHISRESKLTQLNIDLLNIADKPDNYDNELEFEEITKLINENLTPETYKEVMILRYKFEMEYIEIATIMNLTESNIRQIHKRALDKLKSIINR